MEQQFVQDPSDKRSALMRVLDIDTSGEKSEVSLKTKISLIGAVALLLVLSYFTYNSILYSPQHLSASYFEAYRPPVLMQDAPRLVNEDWKKAIEWYENKEYEKAADQFYSMIDNGVYPNYIVRFYAGVSYLGHGTYEGAEYAKEELITVLESKNDFHNPAKWYLALAYVRLDEDEKARETLSEISKTLSYGHERAAELLPMIR